MEGNTVIEKKNESSCVYINGTENISKNNEIAGKNETALKAEENDIIHPKDITSQNINKSLLEVNNHSTGSSTFNVHVESEGKIKKPNTEDEDENYQCYLGNHENANTKTLTDFKREQEDIETEDLQKEENLEKSSSWDCSWIKAERESSPEVVQQMEEDDIDTCDTEIKYEAEVIEEENDVSNVMTNKQELDTKTKNTYKRDVGPLECLECDKIFKTKETYKRHLKCHNVEKSFQCKDCQKKFTWKYQFEQHLRTHTGEKPFACTICDARFLERRGLKKHLKTHSENEIKTAIPKNPSMKICDLCGKELEDDKKLEIHKRKHAGLKPYVCDYCQREFSQCGNYYKHLLTHGEEKRHKCAICDRGFHDTSNLQSHMYTHTGFKPYVCDFCGRGFVQSSTLQMHLRTHTGYKPFSCEFCDKTFTRNDQLQKHRRTHTGDKPYFCDTCGKGFKRDDTLRKHKLLHTGEKPFKCEFCDKDFRQKSGLSCHVKAVHSGELPWECSICGKGYLRKNLLEAHEIKHALKGEVFSSLNNEKSTNNNGLPNQDRDNSTEVDNDSKSTEHLFTKEISGYLKDLVSANLLNQSATFNCEMCHKKFSSKSSLQNHIRRKHSEGNHKFNSSEYLYTDPY